MSAKGPLDTEAKKREIVKFAKDRFHNAFKMRNLNERYYFERLKTDESRNTLKFMFAVF